jgi:hypothetical protein
MSPPDDQAVPTQVGEMLRGGHLGQSQDLLDVAHAQRSRGQEVEDAETLLVPKTSVEAEEGECVHTQE